jgi:hypothetical protein
LASSIVRLAIVNAILGFDVSSHIPVLINTTNNYISGPFSTISGRFSSVWGNFRSLVWLPAFQPATVPVISHALREVIISIPEPNRGSVFSSIA